MKKIVNGQIVDMTPEEEAEFEASRTLTLEQAIEAKCDEVDALRDAKLYSESIPYTFPGDSEPDGIQFRDEKDRTNIQDNVLDAATSDPGAPMVFMPTSNDPKQMTATEMLAMGNFLKRRGDAIFETAWAHKDAIRALATIAETIAETVAETIAEVEAYDITAGWPE